MVWFLAEIPDVLPEGFFPQVWFFFRYYWQQFLGGIGITLLLSILGTIFGFALGLGLAYLRKMEEDKTDSKLVRVLKKIGKGFAYGYIEFFRGTPMMVQAICIFYGVSYIIGRGWPTTVAGIIVVSLNTAAYMAEIIRSGINAIDKGQIEASRSLGMSQGQTMFNVVLPQAIKNVIPAIGNELVVNIKDTSVLSAIMVSDLFYSAQKINVIWYKQFPIYFIVCILYLILTISFTNLLKLIEKKMNVKSYISKPVSVTTPEGFANNEYIHKGYKKESQTESRRL